MRIRPVSPMALAAAALFVLASICATAQNATPPPSAPSSSPNLEEIRKAHRQRIQRLAEARQQKKEAGAMAPRVLPGIDVLLTGRRDLIQGKKVGLLTNPSGITAAGIPSIDALLADPEVQLVALFAPEHGVRGIEYAGDKVQTNSDSLTGLPIYSLYGATRTPSAEWLKGLDALIYDIQDTGNRSYTFYCTMANAMKAAREAGITFIVCDRPNPMGGELVDGNILDASKGTSLVGCFPIAYFYGMTAGELARMINTEFGVGCKLEVVPMKGWKRSMNFGETGLIWVPPSQHVPRFETSYYMGITGTIGELHTVNEGVGYTLPFETLAAEWIDPYEFAAELNARHLPGVYFRPTSYKPRYGVMKDQLVHGVQIHITDYAAIKPITVGLHAMHALQKLYPDRKPLGDENDSASRGRISMFTKVMGTDQARADLLSGKTPEEILASWQPAIAVFMAQRAKYLLYQ